jgi:N6-L-threonylcarbamoyladenine synthase/protein kinase Bud32
MSDITEDTILMEQVQGTLLTDNLSEEALREAGRMVGRLHAGGIVHGDLTTSNLILRNSDSKCVLIDFGLAQATEEIEPRGVDLHVLYQTLESTAPDRADSLKTAFAQGYGETFPHAMDVIAREHEIELRGRYL